MRLNLSGGGRLGLAKSLVILRFSIFTFKEGTQNGEGLFLK